jgi:hypothetical protein
MLSFRNEFLEYGVGWLKAIQGIKVKEGDDGWYFDLLREIGSRL